MGRITGVLFTESRPPLVTSVPDPHTGAEASLLLSTTTPPHTPPPRTAHLFLLTHVRSHFLCPPLCVFCASLMSPDGWTAAAAVLLRLLSERLFVSSTARNCLETAYFFFKEGPAEPGGVIFDPAGRERKEEVQVMTSQGVNPALVPCCCCFSKCPR